jgi:hypothetical protein
MALTGTKTLKLNRAIGGWFTVALVFIISVLLSRSNLANSQPELLIGITYDLTILAPILYLLIIWRSNIPKITAVPVFVLGFIIASFTIPDQQRNHLDLIEFVVLPLVEIGVITLIIIKIRKTIREIKLNQQTDADLYSVLKKSASNVLENEKLGKVFATEIAMIYYGLFRWKKTQPTNNQFTCYKENGIIAIFITLVFLVVVETFVVHLLLIRWNELVAWIIFALSIYAGIQILGHTKALINRFTEITNSHLILRYGLFGDAEIPLTNIKAIRLTQEESNDKTIKALKLLGSMESHNMLIEFDKTIQFESVYGIRRKHTAVLLQIDNLKEFTAKLPESVKNSLPA